MADCTRAEACVQDDRPLRSAREVLQVQSPSAATELLCNTRHARRLVRLRRHCARLPVHAARGFPAGDARAGFGVEVHTVE
eukprot:8463395-Pyramimonas_sp.AAC.1